MSFKRKLKDRLRTLLDAWKTSGVYRFADRKISAHFRRKLRNRDFTILCSTCIGGVIYHRLGQQFLSPTINLFMSQQDLVQLCLRLDDYLAQDLRFLSDRPENHPVGCLGGGDLPEITIFFNHAGTAEEARRDWDRRKVRVNKDNLFIIIYYLDGITEEELRQLEKVPCRNRIVLTGTPLPGISWSHYIRQIPSHQYPHSYLEKDLFGVRYFEKKWDFVSFLNQSAGAKE